MGLLVQGLSGLLGVGGGSSVSPVDPSSEPSVLDYYDMDASFMLEDDDTTPEQGDAVKSITSNKLSRALTQSTASQRPTLTTMGGGNALDFVAASSQVLNGGSSYAQAQPFMICCAITVDSSTSYMAAYGDTGVIHGQVSGGTYRSRAFAGATLDVSNSLAAGPIVFTAYYNGASSYSRVDGVEVASGNAGTNSLTFLEMGGRLGTRYWDGKIGRTIIATSDSKLQEIEKWVADGHSVTLPF